MTKQQTSPDERIVPMDKLHDYEVAQGNPDIRGWHVIAADRTRVGKVEDILVDTAAMRVRYVDVELDRSLRSQERHVLVPIEAVDLDGDRHAVVVDRLAGRDLAALPPYDERTGLTDALLSRLRTSFDAAPAEGVRRAPEAKDRLTLSQEELDVAKRTVPAGAVRVGKQVETERVRQSVPVRQEEVTIEHRPLEPGASTEPSFREGEIHVPLTTEEPVVTKRAVAKEEVVIKKNVVEREQVVEADVKKERISVKPQGNVNVRDQSKR
jgi:uncharacterized protein (TIGR02271 family)